jgi:hypothetical protein
VLVIPPSRSAVSSGNWPGEDDSLLEEDAESRGVVCRVLALCVVGGAVMVAAAAEEGGTVTSVGSCRIESTRPRRKLDREWRGDWDEVEW